MCVAAMMRELCVAYRILEDHGGLHPGDAVIVNGANGAVGTAVVQVCSTLSWFIWDHSPDKRSHTSYI